MSEDKDTFSKLKLKEAQALKGLVEEHRDAIDRDRKLPQPVLDALGNLGVFRAAVPSAAGGGEWDLPTWMRVVEVLAAFDGAVGWNSGVGASATGVFTGWLEQSVARKVSFADRNGVLAGAGAPTGSARPVDGGYLLSGRWQFGSGISHAHWVVGGFALEGESPRLGRVACFPIEAVEVFDTWFVGGMRGTASHDYAVNDLFVPTEYTLDFAENPARYPGPLYRFPTTYVLASPLAPAALGIARGAIDTFIELIKSKTDRYSGTRMRDRMTIQERVAQAEALVLSARALFFETIESHWERVSNGDLLDENQLALGKLSLMHAVDASAKAVDLVYHAAATNAIFTSNPLERYFRDIHVVTQHRFASPQEMYQTGAVMLDAG